MNREEIWRDRLILFAESGLTQTAFCSHHGLSAKALRLWARRLGFVWPPPVKASIPDGTSGERAKEFSGSSKTDLAIPVGELKNLLDVRVRKTWTPEESLALLVDARLIPWHVSRNLPQLRSTTPLPRHNRHPKHEPPRLSPKTGKTPERILRSCCAMGVSCGLLLRSTLT